MPTSRSSVPSAFSGAGQIQPASESADTSKTRQRLGNTLKTAIPERRCARCDETFASRRRDQRFCRAACRVTAHQAAFGRGPSLRERVLARDGWQCRRCGATTGHGRGLYARQVQPGRRTVDNCETTCSRCNAIAAHPNAKPKRLLTEEERRQRRREAGALGASTMRERGYQSRWQYDRYGNLTGEAKRYRSGEALA